MSEWFFKLRILMFYALDAWSNWQHTCKNLDEYICCHGGEFCGCRGSTEREFWEHKLNVEPPNE